MWHPRTLIVPVLCLALLPVPTIAQARHAFAGRVVWPNGSAAAAVQVVCVASAAAETDPASTPDVVRVTADAGGRFRADLLVGRAYSGWAIAEAAGAAGDVAASPVHENLPAVTPTDFVLELARRPRTVTVANAAQWAAHGVATVRIAPLARNVLGVALAIATDGTVNVPPMAGRSLLAEVLDERGSVLFRCGLDAAAADVPLPPPQQVPVHVVDDAGAPVAGAVVEHEVPLPPTSPGALMPAPTWLELRAAATTDAEGNATLVVARTESPLGNPQTRLICTARHDGFADAISGFDGEAFEDARAGQTEPSRLRFVLHRAEPFTVRVLDGDGRPRVGQCVWLRAVCGVQLTGLIGSHERAWTARSGEDGVATFDSLPTAQLLELDVGGRPALHPDALQHGRDFVVDERKARPFPLQVLDAAGAPAANSLLRVTPIVDTWLEPHGLTTRLDAAGRLQLQLPPGAWLIAVTDADGFAIESIAADRGAGPLALRMAKLATMRITALPPAGEPPGAATIGVVQIGRTGEVVPEEAPVDSIATWLAMALVHGAQTDAQGDATLRFVPRNSAFALRCGLRRERTLSGTFDVIASDEVQRVQLAKQR